MEKQAPWHEQLPPDMPKPFTLNDAVGELRGINDYVQGQVEQLEQAADSLAGSQPPKVDEKEGPAEPGLLGEFRVELTRLHTRLQALSYARERIAAALK